MSDKFNGFSQEDIRKMSAAKTKKPSVPAKKQIKGILRMPDQKEAADSLRKEQRKKIDGKEDSSIEKVDLDRSMSKSIEEALFYQPITTNNNQMKISTTNLNSDKKNDSPRSPTNNSSILQSNGIYDASPTSLNSEDSFILNEKMTASPFKGISLKDFEAHRKILEEQNKQKKDLLYKAIEQHSEKTAAEAKKIQEIRAELAQLDNEMANDVLLLRQQIDNACVAYSTIEKQYLKIEAQFLKSKIDLHNALEKKELLTEHLCTVIAHNEDRKAEKLSELMEKVGLSPIGELKGSSTNGYSNNSGN